jgi:glycosyltransferase involved in cell wall biosynthesis
MKTILHISADFPDPLVPVKTRAVSNLVAESAGYRHMVYSLNRVSWRAGVQALPFGEDRVALAYGAPPYGVGLTHYLRLVAKFIEADLARRGVTPDLIHAHKFAVEGLVAAEIAERTRCPFIVSLWGDSDIKIFEAKRLLRARYREMARQAHWLLPAAPWTARYFAKALELDNRQFQVLPVMTAADAILAPTTIDEPRFVTVLSLDAWRRKGLDTLAAAARKLGDRIPGFVIDIYGSGSPKSLIEVRRMIGKAGAKHHLQFMGPAPNGRVQRTMNGYVGFLMPTRRETYAMVHVEALLAGVPILWSQDRGIDGLLDDLDVGYRCDPSSVEDVAAGIEYLLDRQRDLKRNIRNLHAEGAFEHLRRSGIAAHYRNLLARVLSADDVSLRSFAASNPRFEFHAS